MCQGTYVSKMLENGSVVRLLRGPWWSGASDKASNGGLVSKEYGAVMRDKDASWIDRL